MSDNLFDNFSGISDSEWMDRIVQDLKGKIPVESLNTNTQEDVKLNPFYTAESTDKRIVLDVSNNWLTTLKIDLSKAGKSFSLSFSDEELYGYDALFVRFDDVVKLEAALGRIKGKIKGLYLDNTGSEPVSLSDIKIPSEFEIISIGFDLFSQILSSGNIPEDLPEKGLRHFSSQRENKTTRHLYVNACIYKNAGAKIFQEVGCILAELNEYIELVKNKGISLSGSSLLITLACGTDYFMEIAKLRAIRLLTANLFKAHELPFSVVHIVAENSDEVTSHKDPYTNILRRTTSCMSAVLGGCDALVASPFMKGNPKFASRIAKNIQLMLKHESHLDKVANPANGSYFIEQLTVEIAEKSWDYFKEIESSGGFLENLKRGKIQADVVNASELRMVDYTNDSNTLIGINKYSNPDPAEVDLSENQTLPNGPIEALRPVNYALKIESEN